MKIKLLLTLLIVLIIFPVPSFVNLNHTRNAREQEMVKDKDVENEIDLQGSLAESTFGSSSIFL